MANFIDGPARGVKLLLGRAPVMLRAVQPKGGVWDALDQLDDEAKPNERIVVYFRSSEPSRFHICRSPRKQSGWYEEANYSVLPEQPADEDVRTSASWQKWCLANRPRLEKVILDLMNPPHGAA